MGMILVIFIVPAQAMQNQDANLVAPIALYFLFAGFIWKFILYMILEKSIKKNKRYTS
jgi:hypothetical protein